MENQDMAARKLWEKFLRLTQEMLRFLEKENIDMFLELLTQRLALQKNIEALSNDTYHLTPEGKALIAQINPLNRQIQYRTQLWLNTTKRNQTMARAYDSLGYSATGHQLNREF